MTRAGRLPLVLPFLVWAALAQATEVKEVTGESGVNAWFVEEHTIPIVSVAIGFDGGTRLDPAGKEGLAVMTAALLTEGAGEMEAQAFKRRLNDLAIRMGAGADIDSLTLDVSTLSENADEAFRLLGLALNQPRFDPEAVERIRAQMTAVLRQEEEDPETIADRAWWALAFKGHPYGRWENGDFASVAAIARDDIAAYARTWLARDRLKIAVVGDITADHLKILLDRTLGGLPASAPGEAISNFTIAGPGSLAVIAHEMPQSTVVFGSSGPLRLDRDFMAAYVLNYILGGGGFSSRLMDEVREKRGLAYGVSTYLNPMRFAGMFAGSVGTDNARVAQSLALIKQEMARLREEGPSETELRDAKTYLTGSFALRLDSNAKIANQLLAYALQGLPRDYLDKRNAEIEAVTAEDVRRVARTLIRPDDLIVVVVGKPEGLQNAPEEPANPAPESNSGG